MTLAIVPLQATQNQTVQAYLGGQNCTIRCYQLRYGFFVDLYLNNVIVRRGMEALNLNRIVRDKYLGFVGDLFFYDTQGDFDPQYSGVGSRFLLMYDPDL